MSARNKQLIEKINRAFAEGDTHFFLTHLAEDARWNIIGISTITGKSNISKSLEMQALEHKPEITVNNIVAEGNDVLVESTGVATRKSGTPYTASYCDVYHIENGKIKEFTTYVIETF